MNPLTRVLLISTSYPADGADWRGLFIRHMVYGLASTGKIKLSIWAPPGELPDAVTPAAEYGDSKWLRRLMIDGGIAHRVRTGGIPSVLAPLSLIIRLRRLYKREDGHDLYHINWLQNALPLPRDGRPALITVLGTDMQFLKLRGMATLLRRAFRGHRVTICPNAPWMEPELRRHFGDIAEIKFVPFGIEGRWFDIQRHPSATAKWLCVSRLTKKKIGRLFEWGERFFNSASRELHLFGPMQESISVPQWVHYHGAATAEGLCQEWFPTAQGLISLSEHAEGRPQVMIEAMAAGLPIIATNIPAHSDLLTHELTGWLCKDETSLGNALAALEIEHTNLEFGFRARTLARRHFGTWNDCAHRYEKIYANLVGK